MRVMILHMSVWSCVSQFIWRYGSTSQLKAIVLLVQNKSMYKNYCALHKLINILSDILLAHTILFQLKKILKTHLLQNPYQLTV